MLFCQLPVQVLRRASFAAFLTSLAIGLLAGCGSAALRDGLSDPSSTPLAHLSGKVYGGQQPISGAVIQLWAAGTTGYSSAARPLVNCTGPVDGDNIPTAPCSGVVTDTGGNFSITNDYTCPAGAYVYVTSNGGNANYAPGSTTNSAVALMTGIGLCSALTSNTYISVNEVTTAATVTALQQFMSATYGTSFAESVATSSTNITGLANAFETIPQMVSIPQGSAYATSSSTSLVNGTSVILKWTSENAKLNTLGNILSYCVNSGDTFTAGVSTAISSSCANLFTAVKPSAQTNAPADTIQAMMDLALNPTNTSAFTYVGGFPAFTPVLSSAPNDWTLSLAYSSSSTTKYPAGTGTSAVFINGGFDIAVDSNGLVWVLNANGPSVSAIAPGGVPTAQVLNGSYLKLPRGIALDTNNNIYVANSGANSTDPTGAITEYASGTITNYSATSTAYQIYGIAIDGSNNIFAVSQSGTQPELLEVPAGSVAGTIVTPVMKVGIAPQTLAVDPSYNVWVTGTSVAFGGANAVTEAVASCTGTTTITCTYPATGTSYTGGTGSGEMYKPFGISFDSFGSVWVANGGVSTNTDGNQLTKLTPGSPTTGFGTGYMVGGVSDPLYLAVDGGNNIWVPNNGVSNTGTSVSEFDDSGNTLAGSNGFQINFTSGTTPTQSTTAQPRSIAIDPSGNVWVGNYAGALVVNEIVGAAVPAVTPLALAAKNSKFGQRP